MADTSTVFAAEPFDATLTTTALTAVYVNDRESRSLVHLRDMAICNYHASAVTIAVQVYRIGPPIASFRRYSGYSLAANETLVLDWICVLYQGDEIRVSASVANVVDVTGVVAIAT